MMSQREEIIAKILEVLKTTGGRELDLIYVFARSITKK